MKKNFLRLVLIGTLLLFLIFAGRAFYEHSKEKNGLFSWSDVVLEGEARHELFNTMKQLELTVLYQSVSDETDKAVVADFLTEAAEYGIEVWLLTGDPQWGLDPKGGQMISEIERVAEYNKTLPEDIRLRGVLMDSEPYLTEDWDDDSASVMESWVSALKHTRKAAEDNGLRLSACIPYYLDTQGFSAELEELVNQGCDELAIMNYYKENEAQHIETELTLARAASRKVTVIYELKQSGTHGLTEKNTYYNDGLEAVEHSWEAIKEQLGSDKLSMALHDYQALREVMDYE